MKVSQPQLYPGSTNWLQRYCLSITMNKSSEQQARWVSHGNEQGILTNEAVTKLTKEMTIIVATMVPTPLVRNGKMNFAVH